MRLKRPNKEPCYFCERTSSVAATVGSKGKILCVCRSCASEVLPELMADASFLDIQDERLLPESKAQNRSMPREYSLKWDLLGKKFTERLLELAYGYDEFVITEDKQLVSEDHLNKMEELSKSLKKK